MSMTIDLRILELLCGRLCHELVSPVGAINNGVELLGEDDPDFVKEAMALIGQSARKAGQRLQFYRFAYGTGGGSGAAAVDVRELTAALLEGGKVRCDWQPTAVALPLPWRRLACNLVVVAAEALPRGGTVTVGTPSAGAGVQVAAEGDGINLTPELREALGDSVAIDALTARTIHAFYSARLAAALGAQLTLSQPEERRALLTAAAHET